MLREELGDETFFTGLRKYYADFQHSTALTKDFQQVMEEVSGKDLGLFFHQWLWGAGHPVIKMDWHKLNDSAEIVLEQMQQGQMFSFPLEVEIQYENGQRETLSTKMVNRKATLNTKAKGKVKTIIFDPGTKLLFEIDS
jgi:aminopeptidase N